MDRLTIVFINGHEEKYQILQHHPVETSLQMQHFKQLIENDMLKLIIDHEQIQLIPLAQIQKSLFILRTLLISLKKDLMAFYLLQ
jgi:predicted metallo-beta-lactamase superfamily hydrolase